MPTLAQVRCLSPATSLCWAVAAFAVASATARIMPMAAGKLTVFLLPLCWLGALGAGRLADRDASRWMLIALAGLAWMGLDQAVNPLAVEAGWWRWSGRCLALAAALVVATGACGARAQLRTLGASATLVVATVVGVGWWQQRDSANWLAPVSGAPFGLGNINVVVNTTGPALLAWLALVGAAWWQGQRPRWWEWLLLPPGLALHGYVVLGTHRRGALLAAIAAGAWLGLWWLWQRSRRWTVAIALIAAAVAARPLWNEAQKVHGLLRDDARLQMYEAAASAIAQHPLAGVGEEGALRLAVIGTDAARHMTAAGAKAAHVHCEFLDLALAGGLPALAIFLVLWGLAVRRSWRLEDHAVAAALQAGGLALTVHLASDNALGFEVSAIFLGVWAGILLAAPLREPRPPDARLPSAAWLLPPLVAVCLWNATWGWTAAWAGNEPDILRTCVRQSRDPEIVNICAMTALDQQEGPYAERRASIVAAAVGIMGWTDKLAFHGMKERCANGTAVEAIAATVRYLRCKPFNVEAYRFLHQALGRYPALAKDQSGDLLRRLAWINDADPPPLAALALPSSFDDALDTFAAIHWVLIHHPEWPSLGVASTALAEGWGDIPSVAALHQRVLAEVAKAKAKAKEKAE